MSDGPSQEVPIGDPLRDSWEAYKKTVEFQRSREWAATVKHHHLDGSLWAVFVQGFQAGRRGALTALLPHLSGMIRTRIEEELGDG